jgi:hypothetical protein
MFNIRKFSVVHSMEHEVITRVKKFLYNMFKFTHSTFSLVSLTRTVDWYCPVQMRVYATL